MTSVTDLSEWDEERVAKAIAVEFGEIVAENFWGKQGSFDAASCCCLGKPQIMKTYTF